MNIWQILIGLVVGGLCGFAGSKLMKVNGKKWWFYVIVGLLGGLVGGLLGSLIPLGGGWLFSIIFSIIGSCLVVWLYKKFFMK